MNNSLVLLRWSRAPYQGLGLHLLGLCILISCQHPERDLESGLPALDEPGTITLIFHHPPENTRFQLNKGGPSTRRPSEVGYLDDEYQFQGFALDHKALADTHRIQTIRSQVEVIHLFKAIAEIPFWVRKGDTVLFRYSEAGMPTASVLNREVDSLTLNFNTHVRLHVQTDTFSALEKLQNLIIFFDRDRPNFDIAEQIPLQEQEWVEKANQELGLLRSAFDSSITPITARLSDSERAFWETRLELQQLELQVYESGQNGSEVLKRASNFADDWGYTQAFTKVIDRTYFKAILAPMASIKGEKRFYKDFRKVFDQIEGDTLAVGLVRELLLQRSLHGLYENYPQEDFEVYMQRYGEIAGEYVPASTLQERYPIAHPVLLPDALAEVAQSDSLPFQQILARHKGKVVYVDFWATWCAPCIASFPEGEKLKKDYSGKDIAFVYLAADKTYKSWKDKVWKYPLGTESYWMGSQMEGAELGALTIKTLPRYLIYDKTGKLVHRNAPGPGDLQTREFLDRYLGR
ncbi:MAG: TlpA disulfide reductase family protein [Bacteroidota bacterium]